MWIQRTFRKTRKALGDERAIREAAFVHDAPIDQVRELVLRQTAAVAKPQKKQAKAQQEVRRSWREKNFMPPLDDGRKSFFDELTLLAVMSGDDRMDQVIDHAYDAHYSAMASAIGEAQMEGVSMTDARLARSFARSHPLLARHARALAAGMSKTDFFRWFNSRSGAAAPELEAGTRREITS